MATEVWVRNPAAAIREAIEVDVRHFVWDGGYLTNRRLNPIDYLDSHWIGKEGTYRSMIIGDGIAHEYSNGDTLWMPRAIYPAWSYGQDLEDLERFMRDPVVDRPADLNKWADTDRYIVPNYVAPVRGQEHRVVVTDLPEARGKLAEQFFGILRDLQDDYPDCILHLHGSYSYRCMFGLGLAACDMEPRTYAQHGKIILPSGKRVHHQEAKPYKNWINLLGFQVSDLSVPRNRCMFNIKSAQWAGQHYAQNGRFAIRSQQGDGYVDRHDPFQDPVEDGQIMMRSGLKAHQADKWLCDQCSLQLACKFFREGAVCAVPDSEIVQLSEFFKDRDSGRIIEGLGELVAVNTERLSRAMADEADKNKIDPEVTKLVASIFDQGVKLAKLINPALAVPKLSFTLNQNKVAIEAANPQQLMAAVTQELAARGIPMEAITPEMVMQVVAAPQDKRGEAIEAQVKGLMSGAG